MDLLCWGGKDYDATGGDGGALLAGGKGRQTQAEEGAGPETNGEDDSTARRGQRAGDNRGR